ncbi:hypothetical protein AOZ06_16455 [Kibdelosporangium phytohabitans]|uniref:Uncharacterized protein n=2 Tax=Kibdelosporangium phytohabitans TaxID=860235 RepID=A0A0N7F3D0_9PSEU|nr:hypothetical protein AOZ06_16455 [Kibdelosporangium phytohabitans]
MGYLERRAAMVAKQAAPHLRPGEQLQTGFVAATGWFIFKVPTWVIVTDRSIVVLARQGVQRRSREIYSGKPARLYHAITLDRSYKVHRDYYKELVIADEALRAMQSRGNPPDSEEG